MWSCGTRPALAVSSSRTAGANTRAAYARPRELSDQSLRKHAGNLYPVTGYPPLEPTAIEQRKLITRSVHGVCASGHYKIYYYTSYFMFINRYSRPIGVRNYKDRPIRVRTLTRIAHQLKIVFKQLFPILRFDRHRLSYNNIFIVLDQVVVVVRVHRQNIPIITLNGRIRRR